jgi:hypothetical protein
VLASYGIAPVPFSMGPRLSRLNALPVAHVGYLAPNVVRQFKRSICDPRNNYMHKADAFPRSYRDADALVASIEACFVLTIK